MSEHLWVSIICKQHANYGMKMSGLMSMVESNATLFTTAPVLPIANQKSSIASCVSAVPANDVQNQLTELKKQISALALHASQLSSRSTLTLQCFSCGEYGDPPTKCSKPVNCEFLRKLRPC
jgi:hypothetical protein